MHTLFGLAQLDVQALFVHLQTGLHVFYFMGLASCTLQLLLYLRTTVTSQSPLPAGSSLAIINIHFWVTVASRFINHLLLRHWMTPLMPPVIAMHRHSQYKTRTKKEKTMHLGINQRKA